MYKYFIYIKIAKRPGWICFFYLAIFTPVPLAISQSSEPIDSLEILINKIQISMPVTYGDSTIFRYNFVHTGCLCAISKVSTSNSDKMNHIITYSFDLSDFKNGMILIDKPEDEHFKPIKEDIWTMQIGMAGIMVQNTDWGQRQTKSRYFDLFVGGLENRDNIIDAIKNAIGSCGGKIDKITYLVK